MGGTCQCWAVHASGLLATSGPPHGGYAKWTFELGECKLCAAETHGSLLWGFVSAAQEQLKSLSLNIDRLNAAPMASAPSRERRKPRWLKWNVPRGIFGATLVVYFVYFVDCANSTAFLIFLVRFALLRSAAAAVGAAAGAVDGLPCGRLQWVTSEVTERRIEQLKGELLQPVP